VDRSVRYNTYPAFFLGCAVSYARARARFPDPSRARNGHSPRRPGQRTKRSRRSARSQRRPVDPWRRRKAGAPEHGIKLRLCWRKIGQPRHMSESCSARHCRLPKAPIYLTSSTGAAARGLFSRRALASLASLVNNRRRRGSFGSPSFRSRSGGRHCVFHRSRRVRGRSEKSRHRFPPDLR
jgi:hypothetical protein